MIQHSDFIYKKGVHLAWVGLLKLNLSLPRLVREQIDVAARGIANVSATDIVRQ